MYINFWYPIAKSDEVRTYEPHRTMVLGQNLVAFRDPDGDAHVLSDVCIHRGGALGKGWVKEGKVVCPYHGWQFDGEGLCKHIPTLEDDQVPARAKVDSYPVQEKYGIVFAFLGDLPEEERPPLHEVEEFGQKGWRANKLLVFEVGAFYERSMENGLDPSHNEFVHPAQGAPAMLQDFRRKPLKMVDDTWGSKFRLTFETTTEETKALKELASQARDATAGSGFVGPNQMITWIDFANSNGFHQYFFEAPIDESRTRIFFVNMRNFLLEPENDQRLINVNLIVAQEDIDILEALDPVRTPDSPTEEVLVPSDGAVVRYRDFLNQWADKGWRIDMKKLRAEQGDRAFAIPCPARRTSKNWVLNPVPVLPPQ